MTMLLTIRLKYKTSLLDRFFGPHGIIPQWIIDVLIHKSDPMGSIDCLPDHVICQILSNLNTLEDLLNSSLVSRHWYDLIYWKFTQIRHLIGKIQDNCFHSNDRYTMAFNPCTTNLSKLVRSLFNIQTILIETQIIGTSRSLSETSTWDKNFKGFELPGNFSLLLRETNESSQPMESSCDTDEMNRENVQLIEYYSHLIEIHGEYLETLIIFTLEFDQTIFLQKYLIDQIPMSLGKDRKQLILSIPWNSHHYVQSLVSKCPNLRTLYYLVKNSSTWLSDRVSVRPAQHSNLESLILEYWIHQDLPSQIDWFVEIFTNLRQLIMRDCLNLTDDDVYRIIPKLGALENLDVRGCPRITESSESVIFNAQRDLPHRVNYFFGPYQRLNFMKMDSKFLQNFIFNSWVPGSINPFDLYSYLRRDILASDGKDFL